MLIKIKMNFRLFGIFVISILLFSSNRNYAQNAENLVLVTIDGLRWQEVFAGLDEEILGDDRFTSDSAKLHNQFYADDKQEARKKLMPWLWSTIAEEGQIYGNRWLGNKMDCTNIFRFSYPGYNEILTGFSDPYVDTNDKLYNKNKTVLEWLHDKPEFFGKIAAFASWDVFPYIINDKRSMIPVSVHLANSHSLTEKEQWVNEMIRNMPPPFNGIRWDIFTYQLAFEYMKKNKPRVLYIAFDETDDNAHASAYDKYLNSAHQTDKRLEELWTYIQSDPHYKDNTTIIITTDHGRGDELKEEWTSHGKTIIGASQIWLAAMGPGIKALGEVSDKVQLTQSQIAATLAACLGYQYVNSKTEVGSPISTIVNK